MMFYSKVLLLGVALHLLLEEAPAFLLRDIERQKRDSGLLDLEVPGHLSEPPTQVDAFPGDGADATRDRGTRQSQSDSFPAPLERLSVLRQNTPSRRKAKDKRTRVTPPLDMIGGSLLSNLRNKKDEPEEHWEDHTE